MPATPLVVPIGTLNRFDQDRQSILGKQERILIGQVPAGCVIPLGTALLDVQAAQMINGTYICWIDTTGMTNRLIGLIKATFGGGSVTTSAGTVMLDRTTVLTAATGTGAMVTATRQVVLTTPIVGEQYVALTIVVAGGAAPVWTEGEAYGN